MSWIEGLESVVRDDVPLAERNWLRVGGNAEFFAEPNSPEQLATLVERCRDDDRPVRLLGGGSNVLVRDQGVAGVVVSLAAGCFTAITRDGNRVTCGAGARLADLVSHTVGAGLAGLEVLVGIPGTVGGALHGNAGSHGGDIGQWTRRATVLMRGGELIERSASDLVFAYRKSSLDELAILDATLEFEEDAPDTLTRRMQKQWIATKASQPMSQEHAMYAFKDPRGMSAQLLIEQAGLKGTTFGNVELSSRHANFMVAHPGATSEEVLQLVDLLRDKVLASMGIELETHFEIW